MPLVLHNLALPLARGACDFLAAHLLLSRFSAWRRRYQVRRLMPSESHGRGAVIVGRPRLGLAGSAGFEPAVGAFKVRCVTASPQANFCLSAMLGYFAPARYLSIWSATIPGVIASQYGTCFLVFHHRRPLTSVLTAEAGIHCAR